MLLVVEYRKEKPLPSQLASTQRGSVHRIVPSGVNSWRQLCPAKDAPLDDDYEATRATGSTDLRFCSPQPDIGLQYETTDTWLVDCMGCLFIPQISLLFIALTYEGWPG